MSELTDLKISDFVSAYTRLDSVTISVVYAVCNKTLATFWLWVLVFGGEQIEGSFSAAQCKRNENVLCCVAYIIKFLALQTDNLTESRKRVNRRRNA